MRSASDFRRRALGASGLAAAVFLAACGGAETGTAVDVTAYEGARVITGTDAAPIDDAVFLVENGRFTAVGSRADVEVPEGATRVDLTGHTVIPALVNAHIHLSVDEAERTEQLRHMAYYGAGTVVVHGTDEGEAAFRLRDDPPADGARSITAGRGITSPEPGRTEVPFWVTTEEEAREAVRANAEAGADLIKIWVDDRGGQYERLSEPLYTAVIDEAHQHGLKVSAHIFRLEDAKGLIRAGVDAFAHGIRDMDVDEEVMALWAEHPNTTLIPNLPGPGVPADLSWISTLPAEELQAMQAGETERPEAQEAFGIQARNLARIHEAGLPVAFGTDGSTPWAVHLEMEDMVRAGLSPADVLVAATSSSASLFGLEDVGSIAPGKSADFVVLDADPLQDITNTRRIAGVYLRGTAVDRGALRERFVGAAAMQ